MSRRTHHNLRHDHSFGIAPLPRGPFEPVTIHARTSAELVDRIAARHDFVRDV